MLQDKNIILFDGECNFCNFWVNFIIKRDKKDAFRFTSLNSDLGKRLKNQFQVHDQIDTVVLIKNDSFYIKSNAAIEITKNLSGFWFLFVSFKVVPLFIRDYLYDFIAKNRQVFFKNDVCVIQNKNKII